MYAKVKYELQELETLISPRVQSPDFKGEDKAMDENFVAIEADRIKQTLTAELLSFADERHLERYIQCHQQGIIRVMDRITTLLGDKDQNPERDFYNVAYTCLEELLAYIERHFSKYYDQDTKAPEEYTAAAGKKIKANIRKLHESLAAIDADPNIVGLMLHILKEITDSSFVTFRELKYAHEMQSLLFRFLEEWEPTKDVDNELRMILYYLNCNSTRAMTYYAHYVTSQLKDAETNVEKIEKLSFILKGINQAQVKSGIAYDINADSLRDQLNLYIREEIEHEENLHRLTSSPPAHPPGSLLAGFKLKVTLSVSQLAYLIKLLIETQVVLNNNMSQLLNFLTRFVITKRSEAVSYGSFRSKFYAVESGTKESVRRMLLSMVHFIDKT